MEYEERADERFGLNLMYYTEILPVNPSKSTTTKATTGKSTTNFKTINLVPYKYSEYMNW